MRINATDERKCGDCYSCCEVLKIEELKSSNYDKCKYASCNGCSIYEKRPLPCVSYKCMWLTGLGEENQRPDKLGLIFDHNDDKFSKKFRSIAKFDLMIARETFLGASQTKRGRKFLTSLKKKCPIYLFRADGTNKVIAKNEKLKEKVIKIINKAVLNCIEE